MITFRFIPRTAFRIDTFIVQTVESLYILWKTTGNVKWRQWGWAIFQAIDKQTKTESGFAFVKHVDKLPPPLGDAMPR